MSNHKHKKTMPMREALAQWHKDTHEMLDKPIPPDAKEILERMGNPPLSTPAMVQARHVMVNDITDSILRLMNSTNQPGFTAEQNDMASLAYFFTVAGGLIAVQLASYHDHACDFCFGEMMNNIADGVWDYFHHFTEKFVQLDPDHAKKVETH